VVGAALVDNAKELLDGVVALRRTLHAKPELGLALPETKRAVVEALSGLPLDLWESTQTSGVVATLRGARPGPALLLRADMDALRMPEDTGLAFASQNAGTMHACGHDAHTAMLVGAARLLAARRDALAGTVKFLFQPGEEGHFGARIMIAEGILDHAPRVDAAFALHVAPLAPRGAVLTRPGAIMAAADNFHIVLRGRGGHASMPDRALDPVPAACELVQALQAMVTRRVPVSDAGVLTVTRLEAGTTTNVIPEGVLLAGTIRSLSERTRRALHEGLRRVTLGVAAAHELTAEIRLDEGYPVVVNHASFTEFASGVARELFGEVALVPMAAPVMGAEDFSYILQRVPGTFAFFGVRPDGVERPEDLHSNRMLLDEGTMAQGVALHAAIALRYLDGTARTFAPPG
jgi:hippurate hydrolase